MSNDIASNFHIENRMYDDVWVHNEKPVWIVEYPLKGIFQAYKIKSYVSRNKYKKLWAHDNESLSKDGYKTLQDAMEAAV